MTGAGVLRGEGVGSPQRLQLAPARLVVPAAVAPPRPARVGRGDDDGRPRHDQAQRHQPALTPRQDQRTTSPPLPPWWAGRRLAAAEPEGPVAWPVWTIWTVWTVSAR